MNKTSLSKICIYFIRIPKTKIIFFYGKKNSCNENGEHLAKKISTLLYFILEKIGQVLEK